MSLFNRGLDDAFVTAFNKEYDRGGWLSALVDDKEVFLAIRENYVNFYYRGCSLLRMNLEAGALVGEIHYKYLLQPDRKRPYVKVKDGRPNLSTNTKSWFFRDLDDIGAVKRVAKHYAVEEKVGVYDILRANPNIVDVEISFGTSQTETSPQQTRSLDFVALQEFGTEARLVFFEAKLFSNHKALRKKGDAAPEVVRQIEEYSHELELNQQAIIESYRRVCENVMALRGISKQYKEWSTMLKGIADGSWRLHIDMNPRLVVFGFDSDQKGGTVWRRHYHKLRERLDGRVLLCGNSKKFVRGISR